MSSASAKYFTFVCCSLFCVFLKTHEKMPDLLCADSGRNCDESTDGASLCWQSFTTPPNLRSCLKSEYVVLKGSTFGEQWQCVDPNSGEACKYCMLSCMKDVYNIPADEKVNALCSCTPGVTPKRPLPANCYSPTGIDCQWYRDCLEKQYPCAGTEDDYAIAYGEKFCNLYQASFNCFTQKGQKWINATRKCLQVHLAPLLNAGIVPSCKSLRTVAFDSHVGCYVKPEIGAPSVCDLTVDEFVLIFTTIDGAFRSAFSETVKQFYEVGKTCAFPWIKSHIVYLILTVSDPALAVAEFSDVLAGAIFDSVAAKLQWNNRNKTEIYYSAFALESNHKATVGSFDIQLVLTDPKQYDLFYHQDDVSKRVSFNTSVEWLTTAVRNGLSVSGPNGSEVAMVSLGTCSDATCKEIISNTTADTQSTRSVLATTTVQQLTTSKRAGRTVLWGVTATILLPIIILISQGLFPK